jgi:hypothetical protein
MLEKRYVEAASAIVEVLSDPTVPGGSGEQLVLIADYALCAAELNDFELSRQYVKRIDLRLVPTLNCDDAALIYSALASAHLLLGEPEVARGLDDLLRLALHKHESQIVDLRRLIDAYSDYRSESRNL